MAKPDYIFKNGKEQQFHFFFRKPHKTHRADGLCFNPELYKKAKIYVDPHLPTKRMYQVAIEEITHAFFWDKTEKEVGKFSRVLADFLTKMM